MADGQARSVHYDLRGPQELLWGLGLGCEGAMRIVLLRCGPENDWQPLQHLAEAQRAHRQAAVGIVCDSERAEVPVGTLVLADSACGRASLASARLHAALAPPPQGPTAPGTRDAGRAAVPAAAGAPPRILLLGAGPDAVPVVDLAVRLNWKVTLVDHRAAYANRTRFPGAQQLLQAHPQELAAALDLSAFDAARCDHEPSPALGSGVPAHPSPRHPSPTSACSDQPHGATSCSVTSGPAARAARPAARRSACRSGAARRAIALAIVAQLQTFLHASAAPRSSSIRHRARRGSQ
jgi:xanthine/CO dehydrogenase XdhC/CoxF family maturation factor